MADSKISQLTSGTPTTSDTGVMVQGGVNKKFTFGDLPTPTSVTTALNNKVDKTTTVNGQALSSNVTLTKTDVGLGNVDNTSDSTKNAATATLTNKTISGADNTITNIAQSSVTNLTTDLAGKQATLVSGTNIKTVNGNSLLGSGDVTISAAANIAVKDEGTTLTSTVSSFNFVGSGVTATNTGNDVTVTITGGGGGAVDSVNGQTGVVVLDQDDIGDGTTYKQFSETNRKEIVRSLSTAILTYPTITINIDPTKIDISSFIWRKVDGYTDMANPTVTYYTFPGITGLSITNLATQDVTYLAINDTGSVIQLTTNDNGESSRDRVVIGSVVHTSRTQIDSIDKFVNVIGYDIANSVADLSDAIGIINTGNRFSANGANMKINKSSGISTQIGLNIGTSKKSPNRVADGPLTATSFLYSWRNGSGGFNVLPATSDNIIANRYDDGTGGASTPNGSVSVNRWSLQKLWYISSLSLVAVEYGQATYNTQAEAEAARSTETIVNPALLGASFRGWLIVRGGATNLSLSTDAVFVDAGKFGSTTGGTGSGSSTTTLQQAYLNSSQPQITTDATRGAIQNKNGSGSDTNNTEEWVDNSGVVRAFIKGDGSIVSKTITITDDTSSQGQVLPDLSNIVRAATTANITLSGTQTIDGVSLVANDLVLVKNQSTGSQNGVYVVSAGAWTRATNYNTTDHFNRRYIYAISGTTNTATLWINVTRNPTVGTTATTFAQVPLGIGTAANQAAAGNHTHTSIATTAASSIGSSIAYRFTSRTATATTGANDLVVVFSGSTASQIETIPAGTAVSNNSGRFITFKNNATVPWTIRQSASNTLDGSASDIILAVGETISVFNTALNTWVTLNKITSGGGSNPIYQTFIAGELTTGQVARFVSKGTQTIAGVKISTSTLPTGANLNVQVYKNGVLTTNSIFTSDTPISITTGQGATNGIYISTSTAIDNGSLVENDVLYFYITQVGSTLSGTNLEIVVY